MFTGILPFFTFRLWSSQSQYLHLDAKVKKKQDLDEMLETEVTTSFIRQNHHFSTPKLAPSPPSRVRLQKGLKIITFRPHNSHRAPAFRSKSSLFDPRNRTVPPRSAPETAQNHHFWPSNRYVKYGCFKIQNIIWNLDRTFPAH